MASNVNIQSKAAQEARVALTKAFLRAQGDGDDDAATLAGLLAGSLPEWEKDEEEDDE